LEQQQCIYEQTLHGNSSVCFRNNSVCYSRNSCCLVSKNRSALFRNNPSIQQTKKLTQPTARRLHPQIHGWELRKKAQGELIKRDVARIDGELIGNHQFNTMFFHFSPYLAYLPMLLYGIPTISTHGSPLVFHTHEAGHRRYFASGDAKTMELWLKAVQSAAMEVAIGDDACWFCALNMLYIYILPFLLLSLSLLYHCYNYYC
jgi:hypothetical protein